MRGRADGERRSRRALAADYLGRAGRKRARLAGRLTGRATIFAMGGGGFTMEPANPLLDDYVLSLARRARAADLPPADRLAATRRRRSAPSTPRFDDRTCVPTHLSLFRLGARADRRCASTLLEQDIVYVGGGSMRNLLAIWRAHGLDALLREAWEAGIVLAGLSAGAMCWFEAGITRSAGRPSRSRARAAARAR